MDPPEVKSQKLLLLLFNTTVHRVAGGRSGVLSLFLDPLARSIAIKLLLEYTWVGHAAPHEDSDEAGANASRRELINNKSCGLSMNFNSLDETDDEYFCE